MTIFDMTTTEGLRDACREAERRLDQEGEKKIIAEHSEFLQRVRDASPEEREGRAQPREASLRVAGDLATASR